MSLGYFGVAYLMCIGPEDHSPCSSQRLSRVLFVSFFYYFRCGLRHKSIAYEIHKSVAVGRLWIAVYLLVCLIR